MKRCLPAVLSLSTAYVGCAGNNSYTRGAESGVVPSESLMRPIAVYGDSEETVKQQIAQVSKVSSDIRYLTIAGAKGSDVFPVYSQVVSDGTHLLVRSYGSMYVYDESAVKVLYRGSVVTSFPQVTAVRLESLIRDHANRRTSRPATGNRGLSSTERCFDCVTVLKNPTRRNNFASRWASLVDQWQVNPDYVAWSGGTGLRVASNTFRPSSTRRFDEEKKCEYIDGTCYYYYSYSNGSADDGDYYEYSCEDTGDDGGNGGGDDSYSEYNPYTYYQGYRDEPYDPGNYSSSSSCNKVAIMKPEDGKTCSGSTFALGQNYPINDTSDNGSVINQIGIITVPDDQNNAGAIVAYVYYENNGSEYISETANDPSWADAVVSQIPVLGPLAKALDAAHAGTMIKLNGNQYNPLASMLHSMSGFTFGKCFSKPFTG